MMFRNVPLEQFYQRNQSLGQSQRYRDATRGEQYYLSLQYEDLQPWTADAPLFERKPRIVVPLYRETVDQVVRFVWGRAAFPKTIVRPTKDATKKQQRFDVGPVLDQEQAEAVTSFLDAVVDAAGLARMAKEMSNKALVGRSCAVVIGVAGGYVTYHVEPGKHCTPTFDPKRPGALKSLEIVYQHMKEETTFDGVGVRSALFWYRRTIDEQRDVTYQEIRVSSGVQPKWVEDPEKTVEHKLGFCPVRWVMGFKDSSDQIDGAPLIDPSLYPMLDGVNYLTSKRQTAAEYGAEPQPWRSGMIDDEGGETKKSVQEIWDLDKEGSVGFLEAKGNGAATASETLKDLTRSFREACGVVKTDPEVASGKISGVVLELLYEPLIAVATDLRGDLGKDGYTGVLGLILRAICTVVARGEDVWIPGVTEAVDILASAQLRGVWLDPPMMIEWPPFFSDSPQDLLNRVQSANQAVQGRLLSEKSATRFLAPSFGVRDADAEGEQIEEESTEAARAETASFGPIRAPRTDVVAPVDDDEGDEQPDESA